MDNLAVEPALSPAPVTPSAGLVWDGEDWISKSVLYREGRAGGWQLPQSGDQDGTEDQDPWTAVYGETSQPEEGDAVGAVEEVGESGRQREAAEKIGWRDLEPEKTKEDADGVEAALLVDETNTPLLLNSVVGLFLPSVYSLLLQRPAGPGAGQTTAPPHQLFQAVFSWQARVIRAQTFLVHISLLIILAVIFILVTFVTSFNYRPNLLTFPWFCLSTACLVILGIATLLWSLRIHPNTFSLQEEEESQGAGGREDAAEAAEGEREERPWVRVQGEPRLRLGRRRHLTQDSARDSVYSASASMLQSGEWPGRAGQKAAYCLLASLLALAPALAPALLYNLSPDTQLVLVRVDQGAHNQRVVVRVAGTVDQAGFGPEFQVQEVRVRLGGEVLETEGETGLQIVLDTKPQSQWRQGTVTYNTL